MYTKKLIWIFILVIVVLALIYGFNYLNRPEAPAIGKDGKIEGEYTIEGIVSLSKPYVCNFKKSDTASKISGRIYTNGVNVYSEFRILSEAFNNQEFNSFLIIRGEEAYTWTSLAPIGFKSKTVRNASTNASPKEQAQIVGIRDKLPYTCEPWIVVDKTVFDVPSWITFSELR